MSLQSFSIAQNCSKVFWSREVATYFFKFHVVTQRFLCRAKSRLISFGPRKLQFIFFGLQRSRLKSRGSARGNQKRYTYADSKKGLFWPIRQKEKSNHCVRFKFHVFRRNWRVWLCVDSISKNSSVGYDNSNLYFQHLIKLRN